MLAESYTRGSKREDGQMRRQILVAMAFGLVALVAGGCGLWRETPPTVTPIIITATPEPQVIPIVATETPAVTSVLMATDVSFLPTRAATATATPTPAPPITMTPSFTPTVTDTPVTPGVAAFAPVGAAVGASSEACPTQPGGTFGAIYQSSPDIAAAIGCPLSGAVHTASSAYQTFQNGVMFWVSSLGGAPQPTIYALYNNGTYQRFNDTFTEGVDPPSGGESPPEGLLEPVRGFGKVWRTNLGVRDGLGWATSGENGGAAQVQLFERGEMVFVTQAGQTYVLVTGAPGTWTARSGGS